MSKDPKPVIASVTKTSWLPIVLSVVSLCLSMAALWYSWLSPPDISAIASRPALYWQGPNEPGEPPPVPGFKGNNKQLLMVKATCTFANSGAQTGTVSLLALKLEADDGTIWSGSAYWIVDDAQITASDPLSKKVPFSPIVLAAKQTTAHTYVFVVEPPDPDKIDLVPRIFHVTLFTWSPSQKEPVKQQAMTLDMNSAVISVMGSSHDWVGVPSEEIRQQMKTLR
jgi:hypothetical protein